MLCSRETIGILCEYSARGVTGRIVPAAGRFAVSGLPCHAMRGGSAVDQPVFDVGLRVYFLR